MMSTLASRAEAGIELWILFENDRLVCLTFGSVFFSVGPKNQRIIILNSGNPQR